MNDQTHNILPDRSNIRLALEQQGELAHFSTVDPKAAPALAYFLRFLFHFATRLGADRVSSIDPAASAHANVCRFVQFVGNVFSETVPFRSNEQNRILFVSKCKEYYRYLLEKCSEHGIADPRSWRNGIGLQKASEEAPKVCLAVVQEMINHLFALDIETRTRPIPNEHKPAPVTDETAAYHTPRLIKPGWGVTYVATGERYRREATISAESVKKVCPGLPIAIFTDGEVDRDLFDKVEEVRATAHPLLGKTQFLTASPFTKTLFLDADTYCLELFLEVFELLDHFDIAMAHAPVRGKPMIDAVTMKPVLGSDADMPLCFPEFNSGVIAFRNYGKTRETLVAWHDHFALSLAKPQYFYSDQPTLRRRLFASNLKIATLPTEYNFRFPAPAFADGPVKILHGRPEHTGLTGDPQSVYARFGAALNATLGPRVYVRRVGVMRHGTDGRTIL